MRATSPWILLVEDDGDVRSALRDVLRTGERDVHAAANGRAALELLRAGPPPALIFLDLHMPVMDGWEFARELRALAGCADVPIALLSGPWNLHSARTQTISGVVATLMKPVDYRKLFEVADRFCARRAVPVVEAV